MDDGVAKTSSRLGRRESIGKRHEKCTEKDVVENGEEVLNAHVTKKATVPYVYIILGRRYNQFNINGHHQYLPQSCDYITMLQPRNCKQNQFER